MTPQQIQQQLRQHLESLRASGVDWLPMSNERIAFEMAVPTPEPLDPLEATRIELETLADTVSKCERCSSLASTRTQTVFGVGKIEPELCFVGEAPGADEDAQGEPFVGAAGQLLNRIISACGFRREEIYICNTLKCRPPMNRTPKADEVDNCREFFEKQIELVNPRYICALCGTAAKHLLNTTLSVGRLRGQVLDYHGIPVVVTYHPAYLLPHRAETQQELQARKRKVWDDMKFLLNQMGRTV